MDSKLIARFWIWDTAHPQMVGLKDGETYTHETGGPHEEGYSATEYSYTRYGDTIERTISSSWRDCDGPGSSYSECSVDVGSLVIAWDGESDLPLPAWERGESGQRDYFAESMGY